MGLHGYIKILPKGKPKLREKAEKLNPKSVDVHFLIFLWLQPRLHYAPGQVPQSPQENMYYWIINTLLSCC